MYFICLRLVLITQKIYPNCRWVTSFRTLTPYQWRKRSWSFPRLLLSQIDWFAVYYFTWISCPYVVKNIVKIISLRVSNKTLILVSICPSMSCAEWVVVYLIKYFSVNIWHRCSCQNIPHSFFISIISHAGTAKGRMYGV